MTKNKIPSIHVDYLQKSPIQPIIQIGVMPPINPIINIGLLAN